MNSSFESADRFEVLGAAGLLHQAGEHRVGVLLPRRLPHRPCTQPVPTFLFLLLLLLSFPLPSTPFNPPSSPHHLHS